MANEFLQYCIKIEKNDHVDPFINELGLPISTPTSDMLNKYNEANGILAFVTWHGDYYITPYAAQVKEELEKDGYTRDEQINVPMGLPNMNRSGYVWSRYYELVEAYYKNKAFKDSQERLKAIAESRGLSALPEEISNIAMEIPADGLVVISADGTKKLVAPIRYDEFGDRMGLYYDNNDIILFPDTVGKTYVSPFHNEVSEILKKAGYKKGLGFVPLSNGEQIIEPPVFGIAWNELCKQASQKGNSEPTTSDQIR